MKNKFYIYAHINPLKNEIFYIGKGHGKRAFNKNSRSKFWKDTVKKYGYIVDILEEGLTEEEAFEREIFYIQKIGRRDLGTGPLVNLTGGGDGIIGRIISEETKKLMSKKATGRTHSQQTRKKISEFNKGKKLSEEHKIKISKGNKGKHIVSEEHRKKLIECNTGKILSEESRRKISKANKGKKLSEEHKKIISEANRTKIITDESRIKMSQAAKIREAAKKKYNTPEEKHQAKLESNRRYRLKLKNNKKLTIEE